MKLRFALLALVTTAVVAAACSAANTPQLTTSGAGGDLDLTTGAAPQCPTHCSADLHTVIDCNGNVLATCPPDQACGKSGCVHACEGAKENKSTVGCDYYAVEPDTIDVVNGACFAAYVVNTWNAPVSVQIEYAEQTLDAASFAYIPKGNGLSITYQPLPNGEIPPGEVAIVVLASLSGGDFARCPKGVNVAYDGDGAVHGTAYGEAFHIITSAPTVAYDIYPYGGGQSAATSATLLIPTAAWDTNYIAVDAFRKSTAVLGAQPTLAIVAAEDGTKVTIGGPGSGPGQPATHNLDKGQIFQITQDAELTGSPIQSNKPIGVWGGATCLNIDVAEGACDSAHQQIPPVKALGHEYVAVRYRNRFDGQEESPPWRFVGAVDGTVLAYEPAPPPLGAPMTLSRGMVKEFRAPGPFVVRSQDEDHPFYMSAHMTGCGEVNPDQKDSRGDPEFVNVIPGEQYLSSYTFFTDPTYPETNLVLVRRNAGAGFKDVSLDCAGNLGDWQPIGTSGVYEYTRIDLVRHNFEPQGSCDNGRHEIHSDAPFGLVVWGWGSAETGGHAGDGNINGEFYSQAVSYAYPAGAGVKPINNVIVVPK